MPRKISNTFKITNHTVRKRYVHDPICTLVGLHAATRRIKCIVLEHTELTLTNRLRQFADATPFTLERKHAAKWPEPGLIGHSDKIYGDEKNFIGHNCVALIHDGTGQAKRSWDEIKVGLETAEKAGVKRVLIFVNVATGSAGGGKRAIMNGADKIRGEFVIFSELMLAKYPDACIVALPDYRQHVRYGRTMAPGWAVVDL